MKGDDVGRAVAPPGTGQPERRDRRHDQTRIELVERREVEPLGLPIAGRVVDDEHVGDPKEAAQ